MKNFTILFFLLYSSFIFAQDDSLDRQDITIKSQRFGDVISLTAENLKDVFMGYKVALNSGLSIVKPLEVSGTQANPNIKVSLKKCVAFVCQTVKLDIDLTISKVEGSCDENFYLKAELDRSSSTLTDVYEYFYTTICAKRSPEGAKVTLSSFATRARSYNSGMVASNIKQILQLQIAPIIKSLQTELNKNIQIIDQ